MSVEPAGEVLSPCNRSPHYKPHRNHGLQRPVRTWMRLHLINALAGVGVFGGLAWPRTVAEVLLAAQSPRGAPLAGSAIGCAGRAWCVGRPRRLNTAHDAINDIMVPGVRPLCGHLGCVACTGRLCVAGARWLAATRPPNRWLLAGQQLWCSGAWAALVVWARGSAGRTSLAVGYCVCWRQWRGCAPTV